MIKQAYLFLNNFYNIITELNKIESIILNWLNYEVNKISFSFDNLWNRYKTTKKVEEEILDWLVGWDINNLSEYVLIVTEKPLVWLLRIYYTDIIYLNSSDSWETDIIQYDNNNYIDIQIDNIDNFKTIDDFIDLFYDEIIDKIKDNIKNNINLSIDQNKILWPKEINIFLVKEHTSWREWKIEKYNQLIPTINLKVNYNRK